MILGFARLSIRDFESYLKKVIGLDEDDIQIFSEQYNFSLIVYGIPPGNYSNKDNLEVIHHMGDHGGTLQFENDAISMKEKFV